jgi:menaquinol-cytochrome c reductase iron-sulfur subunit
MSQPDTPSQPNRREFLTKAAAVVVGGAVVAVPTIAGLCVVFDPLQRQSEAGGPVKVATLNALPKDGTPMKFSVLAEKVDVWNRTPNVPIGAVYLQRLPDNTVRAFNANCPHAGCPVSFQPGEGKGHFHCPCHNSSFGTDGKILDAKSPSARPLDDLQVEIREGSEIWVKFQNFRAGSREKIPV